MTAYVYRYACACGAERASASLWAEQSWRCDACGRRGCYAAVPGDPIPEDEFSRFLRACDKFSRAAARIGALSRGGRQLDCGCVAVGVSIIAPCEGCYRFGRFVASGDRLAAERRDLAAGEPAPGVRWAGD